MSEDGFFVQVRIANELNTQALLWALMERSEDPSRFVRDFAERDRSYLNVFGEKRRLGVLIRNFGELMLLATDVCYENGDRSDGWKDLSLCEMRDLVLADLKEGLSRAENARSATSNIEMSGEDFDV